MSKRIPFKDLIKSSRASLVVQWLRVRLPMQGTRVHAPVREDPTCCGAAGPMSMVAEPVRLEPVLRNGRGHNSERPAYCKKKISV